MAKLIDFKNIDKHLDSTFIFDTNIWLYIHSDYNENDYGYSKVFEYLLENNCTILLPPIVATEFINRYCRQAFQVFREAKRKETLQAKQNHLRDFSYKLDFRPTPAYILKYNYITSLMNEDIIPVTQFVAICQSDLISAIESPCLADLNDDIIMNIALRTDSVIVSHDKDYLKANNKLKFLRLN